MKKRRYNVILAALILWTVGCGETHKTALPPTAEPLTITQAVTELVQEQPTAPPTLANAAPLISGLDDQIILPGETFAPLALDDYVSDADYTDDALLWTITGNAELQIHVVDRIATITLPHTAWRGSETLRFEVCDPAGGCDAVEITYHVSAEADVVINFIGNEGFFITAGDKKILVDAFFWKMQDSASSPEDAEDMIAARPPYDGVDLILTTHVHDDHFDPLMIGEHLVSSPGAIFVSTGQTVDELREDYAGFEQVQARVVGIELERGASQRLVVNDVGLEILNLPHDHTDNLGFIIYLGGLRLLHMGDFYTSDVPESLAYLQGYQLAEKELDVAFMPYNYLTTPDRHSIALQGVGARYFIPMHYNPKSYYVPHQVGENFPGAIALQDGERSWQVIREE